MIARLIVALLGLAALAAPAWAQSIYWVDTSYPAPRLGRAESDGSSAVSVPLAAGTLPQAIAVDGITSRLYFVEGAFANAHVRRGSVHLNDVADLVSGGSALRGIDLDMVNGRIYWTSSNLVTGSQLHRADLDGGNAQVLFTSPTANFRDLVVVPNIDRVYVADFAGGILSLNLAGASVGDVLPAGTPWGLAWEASSQRLYYTEFESGMIKRGSPNSWSPSALVSGLGNPTHLTIDPLANQIFWIEGAAGAQKIERANLNGSAVQDLGIPMGAYGGIAVGPTVTTGVTPEPDAVVEFGLGAITPNPARGAARIDYAVGRSARVTIRILDVQGRVVATLVDGPREPGRYQAIWDGRTAAGPAAPGLFFVRYQAPDRDRVTRFVLER